MITTITEVILAIITIFISFIIHGIDKIITTYSKDTRHQITTITLKIT